MHIPAYSALPARFWDKVEIDDASGCWRWARGLTTSGYARFGNRVGHLLAYADAFGARGASERVDHTCDNRSCVNPAHLEAVSFVELVDRSMNHNAHRTHCPAGHEYTAANTYSPPRGGRVCRACKRGRSRQVTPGETAACAAPDCARPALQDTGGRPRIYCSDSCKFRVRNGRIIAEHGRPIAA